MGKRVCVYILMMVVCDLQNIQPNKSDPAIRAIGSKVRMYICRHSSIILHMFLSSAVCCCFQNYIIVLLLL